MCPDKRIIPRPEVVWIPVDVTSPACEVQSEVLWIMSGAQAPKGYQIIRYCGSLALPQPRFLSPESRAHAGADSLV